jgi:CheY-like chemotaxis protein/anti-sigma regulatory factor (Ser/Thr protein kinase)
MAPARHARYELRTLEEAELLASELAEQCPEPRRRVAGILELLVNAVEHGNLELSGPDKQRLLREGRWDTELQARLEDPRLGARQVRVTFDRASDGSIALSVEDEGLGFDWRAATAPRTEDGQARSGRGLLLARQLSFDELAWEGRGNKVLARIHPRAEARPAEPSLRLRVLVADDDRIARRMVVGALRGRFDIVEATDGQEAVERFLEAEPDLVILDVAMPRKTGVEAAEEIRALAGDRYLPILLVSAMDEVSTLVEGLARGADDFLPKPFNVRVFESKLTVILRIRDMQARLRDQMRELTGFRQRTEAEHGLAQEVFQRILQRGCRGDSRVATAASPLAMFNGDVVLTAATPSGGFRWMLADVAGHGLSGAIGTVPLSTLFYQLTRDGVSLRLMLDTMSAELKATLPSRLFCAATALELDASRRRLTVFNLGMPDVHLRRAGGELLALPSRNLPLAIAPDVELEHDELAVFPGDRIYAVSDGIVECQDPAGEMFGLDRLRAALTQGAPEHVFTDLQTAVRVFSADMQSDDVSLLEVQV